MISLQRVSKMYKNGVVALDDVSIEVEKGEFVFLVGPSGSGKSSSLRLLLREEDPTSGEVFVAGKNLSKLSTWSGRPTEKTRSEMPGCVSSIALRMASSSGCLILWGSAQCSVLSAQ